MTTLLQIPNAMIAPATWPPTGGLALDPGYPYDPFQKHAILAMEAGDDVFVGAKTGSGKTAVGEYLIAKILKEGGGGRIFYTTPIKSLSNQKYKDLKKLFPAATVGILTGDIKMCPDASIVVMTAEILCNLLKKRGTATESVGTTAAVSLDGVRGIVMDEAHYIQDPDRGHVWEETLLLCPPSISLVLLSATMPSAASLAEWISEQRQKRMWLLMTTYRIVPLTHAVLSLENKVVPLLTAAGAWAPDGYASWNRERKALEVSATAHKRAVEIRRKDGYAAPPPSSSSKARIENPIQRLHRCVDWLREAAKMPALFFIFSRKKCEELASLVTANLLDASDVAAATHIFDFHLSRYREALEASGQYHTVRSLIQKGVAFHHSGLIPVLKEIVEILFTRGYIKVLFATETFSVGLNMPTKTVIFLELEKFSDGGAKRALRTDEYTQMAGRAGRRGIDTEGLVLYHPIYDPVDSLTLRSMLTGALPPLRSQMRFHYDFILKQHLNPDAVDIVTKSYWALQQKEARVAEGKELEALRTALTTAQAAVTAEDTAAFEEEARLEERVRSTKNAAYKKAVKERDAWASEHGGMYWTSKRAAYQKLQELTKQVGGKEALITEWDAAPLLSLESQDAFLKEVGLLDASGSALTPMGITATEVNEGNPILMAALAESGRLADLSGKEVACILAAFIHDAGEQPSLHSLDLSPATVTVLEWIDGETIRLQKLEESLGICSPYGFWDLSAKWVGVVAAWLSGDSLSKIAADWTLFEGNVQRALLQVANVLEEWNAIATLRRDLPMLEKMATVRLVAGREDIVVDSLYLRI